MNRIAEPAESYKTLLFSLQTECLLLPASYQEGILNDDKTNFSLNQSLINHIT